MGQEILLCQQTVYYAFAWALSYFVWAEKAHKATISGKGKRARCMLGEGTYFTWVCQSLNCSPASAFTHSSELVYKPYAVFHEN